MTIEEFEERGYWIDIMAHAYAYGKYNLEENYHDFQEFELRDGGDVEYRIMDSESNIIESNFWNIEDALEYIENMEE